MPGYPVHRGTKRAGPPGGRLTTAIVAYLAFVVVVGYALVQTDDPRVEEEANMESMTDTLAGRVDQMIKAYRGREIGSDTGTRACVEELIARNEALEEIVRALAVELERLTARFERTIEHLDHPPDGYSVTYPLD